MCSNMCARPVSPLGSCAEPASTRVKKEKTGASGRSQTRSVRPLGNCFTVILFSNEAMSWAAASVDSRTRHRRTREKRDFIGPPQRGEPVIEITCAKGKLSNRGVVSCTGSAAEVKEDRDAGEDDEQSDAGVFQVFGEGVVEQERRSCDEQRRYDRVAPGFIRAARSGIAAAEHEHRAAGDHIEKPLGKNRERKELLKTSGR